MPVGKVKNMSRHVELTAYLQKYFGFDRFKGEQEAAI